MLTGREHAQLAARRLGRRLLVVLLVLGVVGAAGAVAFVGVTFLMSVPTRGVGSCEPNPERMPVEASGSSGLTGEQLTNAAAIVSTGRAMEVPERGLWVGLATALQESGLRNLDYGDRDSLGLFQQRPSQGWGSPAQVRDPTYAAERFFERLLAVPGWTEMPLWQAAQTVQRSAFPLAYAKWEQTAADALAEVAESPAAAPRARPATSPSPGSSGAAGPCRGESEDVDPAAPFAGNSNGCTEDDPTTNGCVTPVTRYALDQAERAFGGLRRGELMRSTGCHATRPSNPTSDHPLGKGCDFFPGTAGLGAQGIELANGWRAADWFRTNADALEVSYIIWQGRIWTPGVPDEGGWGRRYSGGGVYDPTDAVGGHYDHIHVSFAR
ncbi:hypothetical protein [Pseudonocardia sp. WMMC193]|uniref:hypothetical protein n=1 Tax=Pseudonocardia sp. WMMC193 TaxID=2911965 RepID=UPI001F443D82|nr:hypothetical protein [Pseudonocardia sp. WMMC193]MCF7547435.1 hypothetical protein [Pseudonocardia sp. WMMC193]